MRERVHAETNVVGSGSIAFASRQFAIMDVGNVRIGQVAGRTVISAQEESRINGTSSVVLYGSVGSVMTDMLLRNSTGAFEVYDISNNKITNV